jgi:hypothetical protein
VLEELARAARDGYVLPAAFVAAHRPGDVEQAFSLDARIDGQSDAA